jgi:outer membrane protein assembly factor BamB
MTPQLYDNTVLISTVPGNSSTFYAGGALGVVWALDAATGEPKWKFNTIADGAKLFGNPKVEQRRRTLVSARCRQQRSRLHLRR